MLIIFLYIGIKYNVYYYLFFVGLIVIGRSYERIETFVTLKQIKKYLTDNNLLDKIGNIDY